VPTAGAILDLFFASCQTIAITARSYRLKDHATAGRKREQKIEEEIRAERMLPGPRAKARSSAPARFISLGAPYGKRSILITSRPTLIGRDKREPLWNGEI